MENIITFNDLRQGSYVYVICTIPDRWRIRKVKVQDAKNSSMYKGDLVLKTVGGEGTLVIPKESRDKSFSETQCYLIATSEEVMKKNVIPVYQRVISEADERIRNAKESLDFVIKQRNRMNMMLADIITG